MDVVDDELIREKVRQEIKSYKNRRFEITNSQILSIFIGFILTAGIGTIVTMRVQLWIEEEQRKEEIRNLRVRTIAEISELIFERKTRTELLASSFKRQATLAEIMERKSLYDDAYYNFNKKLRSIQLSIRDITESETYSDIESQMNNGLLPKFRLLDIELTNYYDQSVNGIPYEYKADSIRSWLNYCSNCGRGLTAYLWTKTNYNQSDSLIQVSKNTFKELCEKGW